jgi:hypothetical protein
MRCPPFGRTHRREAELGLCLRKKGCSDPLQNVLHLWGTGEERPAGNLTVAEKHALLEEARSKGEGLSLNSSFGRSVISRVANLGKGIADTDNPMLLAQHQWLESTDHRHRYGAHLFNYYALWAAADTTDSFFYWLDDGEGKSVEIAGSGKKAVTRAQLNAAEVRYCNKGERKEFVVQIVDGKMRWVNQENKLVHSQKEPKAKEEVRFPTYLSVGFQYFSLCFDGLVIDIDRADRWSR